MFLCITLDICLPTGNGVFKVTRFFLIWARTALISSGDSPLVFIGDSFTLWGEVLLYALVSSLSIEGASIKVLVWDTSSSPQRLRNIGLVSSAAGNPSRNGILKKKLV